ncbi:MAG TPA: ATP-binding protein [Vicinamibacteria bacterium]|nr:ATP-binding protein [Vicinamibacteria bacterium]
MREVGDGRPLASEAGGEHPYPGLLAFTEADAERFFGREAEVEALWEKIRRQKLLAVIGPSGVGKTSFLRAGVIPSRPSGWKVAYATPGSSPVSALARALVPDLAGDAEAMGELLQGVEELKETGEANGAVSAVRRWRKASTEALVVLDQFEELFALNAPEVQGRFASFLGRLAEEAEVHVLLSLRDDFLFRCSEQDGLRPVFHDLTPLTPPSPEALRRALVEPAKREGYRFDEDALVEEMVEAVASERGALPLLAFAVSRLWEERDRGRKLLTREAYERIEGVAGALAQHAETTLSGRGPEREGMVREVFRNLVTAQGTRAAADRTELLSVFGEKRDEAGAVLDALVDARLLTEYEAEDAHSGQGPPAAQHGEALAEARDDGGHRRVEIVHESLLTHWVWASSASSGAEARPRGGRWLPRLCGPKPATCSPWARQNGRSTRLRLLPMRRKAWSWPTPRRLGSSPSASCRTPRRHSWRGWTSRMALAPFRCRSTRMAIGSPWAARGRSSCATAMVASPSSWRASTRATVHTSRWGSDRTTTCWSPTRPARFVCGRFPTGARFGG